MFAGVCASLCSVFHVCMKLCSIALGMFPIHVHAYIAHVPRGRVCVCVCVCVCVSGPTEAACKPAKYTTGLKTPSPQLAGADCARRGRCPNGTDRAQT